MPKVTVQFTCSECGTTSGRWLGKCPGCGVFGSLVEQLHGSPTESVAAVALKPIPIGSVRVEDADRISTGVAELDRVLGGGLVPGSLVLVGGEPGIGKSTLMLQLSAALAGAGKKALIVSGEESEEQIRLRAGRLGPIPEGLWSHCETDLEAVVEQAPRAKPDALIIDSIQTLARADIEGGPGSVTQVRECGLAL